MQTSASETGKDAIENPSNRDSATAATISSQVPIQEEDPLSLRTVRRRKYDSRWKQQGLIACRQRFDVLHVIILFVTLGVSFMAIGGFCFFLVSDYPTVILVDYTNCRNTLNTTVNAASNNPDVTTHVKNKTYIPDLQAKETPSKIKFTRCICNLIIHIDEKHLPKDGRSLVLFYQLNDFHQNIRRYKKDVDWQQLGGSAVTSNGQAIVPQCAVKTDRNGKPIFPCGKVANSYFSDTFKVKDPKGDEVKLDTEKIACYADKTRFKNPSIEQLKGMNITTLFTLPKDWHNDLQAGFLEGKRIEDEHFIVWMRTAALENFRKKYAFMDLNQTGNYTVEIHYRYEVKSFRGSKLIVIAADSQDRPVDQFFTYCYIGVGGICLLIGPLFDITNCVMNDNDMEDPPTKDTTEMPSTLSVKTSKTSVVTERKKF